MFGDVKAELKIGEPDVTVKVGGGGRSPVEGGKLEGGTGVVGIMVMIFEAEFVFNPWFISKNFRALATSSDSHFFLLFGVEASPGLELGCFLLLATPAPPPSGLTVAEARFRDFFLVELVEVEEVGVPNPS